MSEFALVSIDLYAARTGNGFRVAIALEEAGVAFRPIEIDLRKPRDAAYLALNPTGRIPTLVDQGCTHPIVVTQTAAIILYIARKSDRLLPKGEAAQARALEWMMAFTTDVIAPSSAAFFMRMARVADCEESAVWLEGRARDQLRFANAALTGSEFLAGDVFSVADVVAFPIVAALKDVKWTDLPHLARWRTSVAERQGVIRGMQIFGSQ